MRNVRGTVPRRMLRRAVGGTAAQRTEQTSVVRHPVTNQHGVDCNDSPRAPVHTPRALAHAIDIKQNHVPRQQSLS